MTVTASPTGLTRAPQAHPQSSLANSSDENGQDEELLAALRSSTLSAKWAIPIGAGFAFSAVHAFSLAADASIERWLTRRGVKHPPRLMGAAAAFLSLVESVSTAHETHQREVARAQLHRLRRTKHTGTQTTPPTLSAVKSPYGGSGCSIGTGEGVS